MSNSKRILVVDDEKDILLIIKRTLEKWAYIVDTFYRPEEALGHFQKNIQAYDLILCDIRMPGMSGFEFVTLVRQLNMNVKLILMTAFEVDSTTLREALPTVKIDDLLKKPFVITEICKIIDRHLAKQNGR
jgi:CheY-like chemotaxis protein